MKGKTFGTVIFVLFFVLAGSISGAYALSFPTYFKFKFENWEYFNPNIQPGNVMPDGIEDNWGVAQVTSIYDLQNPGSLPTWLIGDDGEEIRVFFYGLDLAYWDSATHEYGMTQAYGGAYMDLYLWDSDDPDYVPLDLNTTNRYSYNEYDTITNGGVRLVRFEYTHGVTPNPYIVSAGTTSSSTNPPTGRGTAFLRVVPNSGTMANTFDQNRVLSALDMAGIAYETAWIDPEADLFIDFNFYSLTNPIGGFQLRSDDPAYGAVPEPATLMLMGSGLLLAGGFGRKKLFKRGK